MTRERKLPEELLSAYLDDECTIEERAEVERAIETDADARTLLENLRHLRGFFREVDLDPPGFRPVDLGALGVGAPNLEPAPAASSTPAPAAAGTPTSAMLQIDRETLTGLLADRDRLHHRSLRTIAWTAAISGIAGMAVALLVGGLFFWSAGRRAQPEPGVVPTQPQVVNNPSVGPSTGPSVTPVGVKTPMLEPVPELEALTMASNSCIIENLNSSDDINTAVFQIPDADGEMITVIWLTGIDAGSTI